MGQTAYQAGREFFDQGGYDQGLGQLVATARGDHVNQPNPYLDQVLGHAQDDAAARIQAQFAGAGRLGSGANTQVLARELGNISTGARAENFERERQRQQQAAGQLMGTGVQYAGMAPGLDQARMFSTDMRARAAQMRDQMLNAGRNSQLQRLQFQSGLLGNLAGVGGTQSGTTTQEQPDSTFNDIMGGVLGIGSLLMGNPMPLAGMAANAMDGYY